MIISHKHKFIFIKTVKTASTSMEIALSKFCANTDVLTPLVEEDEQLRFELTQNTSRNFHLKLSQWKKIDWMYFLHRRQRPKYGKHCSARYIKPRVSKKMWDSYYKFCFDRNPWDKAVSFYYWQTRHLSQQPSFSQYFSKLNKTKLSNARKYSDNGQLLVDDVFKYEDLNQSLEIISNKLGIPVNEAFPITKNTTRNSAKTYQQLINQQQAEQILDQCKTEIELLKYEF